MASKDYLERHARHILLKEIGGAGLAKLSAARVSIIGAGALGGPCALYLAAAGCGQIELWDDDQVEVSNLQRQVQFTTADLAAPKAETLARRLAALDPALNVSVRAERFGPASVPTGSIIIDASDNWDTRFALNTLAAKTGRTLVTGAAIGWQGQVSVFTGAPCYACFVPERPPDGQDCASIGVVGAVTGIVGARMALEALKLITGAGAPLIGQLWRTDGLSGVSRIARIHPDPECPVCSGESFL